MPDVAHGTMSSGPQAPPQIWKYDGRRGVLPYSQTHGELGPRVLINLHAQGWAETVPSPRTQPLCRGWHQACGTQSQCTRQEEVGLGLRGPGINACASTWHMGLIQPMDQLWATHLPHGAKRLSTTDLRHKMEVKRH